MDGTLLSHVPVTNYLLHIRWQLTSLYFITQVNFYAKKEALKMLKQYNTCILKSGQPAVHSAAGTRNAKVLRYKYSYDRQKLTRREC